MLNLLETYARLNDNPPIIRASSRTLHRWEFSREEFRCYPKKFADIQANRRYSRFTRADKVAAFSFTYEFIRWKFILAAPFADVQCRSSERFVYQCFLYG